jgi:hypothetical protein
LFLPRLDDTVTAASERAAHKTTIGIGRIPIVTRLSWREYSITASWNGAYPGAPIVVILVSIIALLLSQVSDSVTADVHLTGRETVIAVVLVAVIALFGRVVAYPVAAYVRLTRGEARIEV